MVKDKIYLGSTERAILKCCEFLGFSASSEMAEGDPIKYYTITIDCPKSKEAYIDMFIGLYLKITDD